MTLISAPFLTVQSLGMSFRGPDGLFEAVQDISFSLSQREFISILGPSGCGKSTLLRLIAGLIKPSCGEITFGCSGIEPNFGLVFQQANLMPWRTVLENIILPLEITGLNKGVAEERARKMIHLVGLDDFENAWPSELSGGMAQRVAIARAFIAEPDLLLLDEPFGALDALTRDRMGDELLRLWQNSQRAVILITHSISEALLLSDRVIVLSPRPARLVMEMDVDLPRPREEEIRYSPEFQKLERKLRKAIEY